MLRIAVNKNLGSCLLCLADGFVYPVRRLSTVRKRFYKSVTVTQSNGVFEVNLDGRKLKTPAGKVFQVPNEALALAVAHEWDSQESTLQQSSMHLTGLANTALDDPLQKSSESLTKIILSFLETDTLLYRQEEPEELWKLQKKEWDPVIDWINERYSVKLEVSTDIVGPSIPKTVQDTFERHLLSFNSWSLTGFEFAVNSVKSVLLTLAVVDRRLTVEEAVRLSRLEQEFQIERWGNVEWYHDIELMDMRSRLSAATLFIYATSQNESIKKIVKQ